MEGAGLLVVEDGVELDRKGEGPTLLAVSLMCVCVSE